MLSLYIAVGLLRPELRVWCDRGPGEAGSSTQKRQRLSAGAEYQLCVRRRTGDRCRCVCGDCERGAAAAGPTGSRALRAGQPRPLARPGHLTNRSVDLLCVVPPHSSDLHRPRQTPMTAMISPLTSADTICTRPHAENSCVSIETLLAY